MSDPIRSPIDPAAGVHSTLTGAPARPVTPRPLPTVPGYELGAEIGRGGMGVVYRARDLGIGREVAVKLLQGRFAADSEAATRFVEEARITGQLQHPGIPAVHQVGFLPDGRPYLAMKLIKGATLEELLKASPVNTLAVFEGVCQAVGFAHAHNVIHRDLKPQNVMVGSFGEVQVMDWGLAKLLTRQAGDGTGSAANREGAKDDLTEIRDARGPDAPNTEHGSVFGTPAYMAPEQAAGETGKIGRRSDVFGLGAILCRMLTGHPPFAGQYTEVRLNAVRGNTAAAVARLDGCGAEPGLVALCKACLSFDPDARPADANAVAVAVAALRGEAEERARRAELDRAKAEVREEEEWKRREVEHRLTEERRAEERKRLESEVLRHQERLAAEGKRRRAVQRAGGLLAAVLLSGVVGTTIGLLQARYAKRRESERADGERRAKEREAEQRADAVAARNELWDGLDAMTTGITGDSLATQKEITPEQEKFLAALLPLYQKLAAKTGDDEKTRDRMASAAFRVGMIEHRIGRQEEGAAAFRTARDEYERLAADFPAELAYRQKLGHSHANLGVLLPDLGRWEEAEGQHKKGLAIREALVAGSPAHPDYRRDLAASYSNLGALLATVDRRAEARELHEKGLAIRERLAAEFPGAPVHRQALAQSHINLGDLLRYLRLREAAEGQYKKGLAIQKQLVADYPDDTGYRVDLGASCSNFGIWVRDGDRPEGSLEWFDHAIDTLCPIREKEPQHGMVKKFLRNSYLNRATAYDRLRRFDEAAADWDRVVPLCDTPWKQAAARNKRGVSLIQAGKAADALADAERTVSSPTATDTDLYQMGCVYAFAAGRIAVKEREYADRAMELLNAAVKAGYQNAAWMAEDPDLAPLRERKDFKKLLADLVAKFPPKVEVLPSPRQE